jgi:hypothetical protein
MHPPPSSFTPSHPALKPEHDHDHDDGRTRHKPEDEEAVGGLEEGKVLELEEEGGEGEAVRIWERFRRKGGLVMGAGGDVRTFMPKTPVRNWAGRHMTVTWEAEGGREGGREGGKEKGSERVAGLLLATLPLLPPPSSLLPPPPPAVAPW